LEVESLLWYSLAIGRCHDLEIQPMQRFFANLLILLFAFEIGACPCGCLDHNGWLELLTANEETAPPAPISLSFAMPDERTPSVVEHHCDGAGKLKYRPSERPRELTHDSCCKAALDDISAAVPSTTRAARVHYAGFSYNACMTLPLRAALQVWLA
jgi:hypothetical protein